LFKHTGSISRSTGAFFNRLLEHIQEREYHRLENKIEDVALTVPTALVESTPRLADTQHLKDEKDRAQQKLAEAQRIRDSIHGGTVIKVNGGNVGKNHEVERLRTEAHNSLKPLKPKKVRLGKQVSSTLVGTKHDSIWMELKSHLDTLELIERNRAWYYNWWIMRVITWTVGIMLYIPLLLFVALLRDMFKSPFSR
jgi:hypothetical protein